MLRAVGLVLATAEPNFERPVDALQVERASQPETPAAPGEG